MQQQQRWWRLLSSTSRIVCRGNHPEGSPSLACHPRCQQARTCSCTLTHRQGSALTDGTRSPLHSSSARHSDGTPTLVICYHGWEWVVQSCHPRSLGVADHKISDLQAVGLQEQHWADATKQLSALIMQLYHPTSDPQPSPDKGHLVVSEPLKGSRTPERHGGRVL